MIFTVCVCVCVCVCVLFCLVPYHLLKRGYMHARIISNGVIEMHVYGYVVSIYPHAFYFQTIYVIETCKGTTLVLGPSCKNTAPVLGSFCDFMMCRSATWLACTVNFDFHCFACSPPGVEEKYI
jgi:hypothetical protein